MKRCDVRSSGRFGWVCKFFFSSLGPCGPAALSLDLASLCFQTLPDASSAGSGVRAHACSLGGAFVMPEQFSKSRNAKRE